MISTHSAHEDGDDVYKNFAMNYIGFQPTPPTRTETVMHPRHTKTEFQFQPTPPTRTETETKIMEHYWFRISTHSAHEDGDVNDKISIKLKIIFQPTPPTRTETGQKTPLLLYGTISTHSAHEDGDCTWSLKILYPVISTHSAHEDGDPLVLLHLRLLSPISTHSAHEDGDQLISIT